MKLFSVAYRNSYGDLCLVGTAEPSIDPIAAAVRHANRDGQGRFVIAETVVAWRQFHNSRPADNANGSSNGV